jgi:tetratricopeptide (TPR) repeat protein
VFMPEKTTALIMLILSALATPGVFVAAQGQSAEQLYSEANGAYDRGEVSRAISLYQQLVSLQPDSIPARTNLAVALAHVGRYEEAIVQYQQALKRDPTNSVVKLNLALAWYKEAEFDKATSELEGLRKENADSQQVLYLLSDCYLRLGRNSDAVALLEPVYREKPDDRVVDYALGTALIREGQIPQGEAVIDRILKDGNTAEANLLMGEAQFAAADYKTAAVTLHNALDLNSDLPGGWSLYGRALLNTDDHAGAKTAFNRALTADPNDFSANLYLGAVLRREGNNAEAAPYLDKALRLRPASPEASFQIGALDAAAGKLDEARKEFEQLERAWPDFLEVHVQLANVYSRLKLQEESQRERDIVFKLNEKARAKKPEPKP